MQVYLPIAEMAVRGEAILLLGGLVGFMSGVFGVGGGFLTTPLLIFMGLPPAIAVGTQVSQLVASSLTGTLGHFLRGNVDTKMGSVMLAGSLPGAIFGMLIFRILQYFGQIDIVIPVLYIVMLGGMGALMLFESFESVWRKAKPKAETLPFCQRPLFERLPHKMKFPRSSLHVSAFVPAGIGFVGGLLVSGMGVGGGFFLVPAMIYILGMPTLMAVGTSLFQIMLTSMFVTILHSVTSHTVDLVLAFFLITGAAIGAQAGVRFARKIPAVYARFLLATLLLLVSFELSAQLFIHPADVYTTEVR